MARTSRKRAVLEDQGLLLVRPSARATLVAGIDEAGRGCFAGPVVAGAVVFPEGFDLMGLDDSKVLKEEERRRLAGEIRALAPGWGIGLAWMAEIEKYNILQATLMAMTRAVAALRRRMGAGREDGIPARVLIDGTQLIPPAYFRNFGVPLPEQRAIVDGDALIPAISAARNRRSPATISYFPGVNSISRTRIGWITPCSRMESARSCSAFMSKSLRGWSRRA